MTSETPETITIVKAVCTSSACPSQWDAWDAEGNYFYLRYRYGCGSVEQYETADWVLADTDQFVRRIAEFTFGNGLSGMISLEDFCEKAGLRLADTAERTAFWRNVSNRLSEEFQDDPAALAATDQLLGGFDLDEG